MRILVLSRSPWRNDNGTGRTLTDIMSAFPNAEIYSLCMREQAPQNDIAKENFFISEMQMIKKLLKKGNVGQKSKKNNETSSKFEDGIYTQSNARNNTFLWIAREILWNIGGWKNDNLRAYIDEVKPDVIFSPVFPGCYPQKLILHIQKISGAKVVVFHMDDNYTLKKVSFSPLFWMYRLVMRRWVKKISVLANINYVISDIQKIDYEKAFKRECKVLTKSADFSGEAPIKDEYNKPLQLVYTGNIGLNRWRSLAQIANVLEKINKDVVKAQLRIYTGNTLTEKMNKALNIGESSFVMGSVSSNEVLEIQENADMLVHIEAKDLKNRLIVRQSFSTKIVDYLKSARPILAYGPKEVASISHLIKNDCAIVADNEQELYKELLKVIDDKSALNDLSTKAFNCGKNYHDSSLINKMLTDDLKSI